MIIVQDAMKKNDDGKRYVVPSFGSTWSAMEEVNSAVIARPWVWNAEEGP